MPYALLIFEDPAQRGTRSEAEGRDLYARMQAFGESLAAEGKLVHVESLASADAAVRVQRRGGSTRLIDGPYAEAKEMIGGFFLLRDVSRDEALAIAGRCPAADWATVEVRPLAPCFDGSVR
ncbi:MAG: dehydrogenase [Burkholderiaceae bacterium]|nr:dehydrogenase [Rhodoferax sp.]MCP5283452.1 dehydrogenase [Burkholderiaceae bacterium]